MSRSVGPQLARSNASIPTKVSTSTATQRTSNVDNRTPDTHLHAISHVRQCSRLSETIACPSFHGILIPHPTEPVRNRKSTNKYIPRPSTNKPRPSTHQTPPHSHVQRRSTKISIAALDVKTPPAPASVSGPQNSKDTPNTSISDAEADEDGQPSGAVRYVNRMSPTFVQCSFEIRGFLRGVGFKKYTVRQARNLELGGWCRQLSDGRICGELEGPGDRVTAMQNWLQLEGSPMAHIRSASFSMARSVPENKRRFDSFAVRRRSIATHERIGAAAPAEA